MIPQFTCTDAYYYQFTRKRFELLGIVPMGTYCYICGAISSCEYNNQKVCKGCYDSLTHNNSYVFNNVRYYCTGKNEQNYEEWASEKLLTSDCKHYNFIYSLQSVVFNTFNPRKMLLLTYANCYNRSLLKKRKEN